jgi:hypothetical protein
MPSKGGGVHPIAYGRPYLDVSFVLDTEAGDISGFTLSAVMFRKPLTPTA